MVVKDGNLFENNLLYIDAGEAEKSEVIEADQVSDLTATTQYVGPSLTLNLGLVSSLIPFINHNSMVKGTMGVKMLK